MTTFLVPVSRFQRLWDDVYNSNILKNSVNTYTFELSIHLYNLVHHLYISALYTLYNLYIDTHLYILIISYISIQHHYFPIMVVVEFSRENKEFNDDIVYVGLSFDTFINLYR
jgi:hypothetical protein